MSDEPRLVVDGLIFPEGPRWHEEALWFSDMRAGRVYRVPGGIGEPEIVVEIDDRPSGLGWLPSGELLVVSMTRRLILRIQDGRSSVHADLAKWVTGDANDMVTDAAGRAYIGNFGRGYSEGTEVEETNLVIVEPDGTVREAPGNLLFPNGCVIRADGRALIVAEGFRRQLTEFAISRDGGLSVRTVFAGLDDIPDGIALDAAGGVWVALPLKQEFIRVERGGRVTDRISVAPAGAFACTLGGSNRRTLFLCTATGEREEIRAGRSEGAILAVQARYPGSGWP